ncbi:MAG TPA: tRNA glutamyl-Q(34) synthetase GluQRS [Thermoleophilaceae bacterium]|nr:tRNA glutamyl-Q(34) synthetase GluQRS [Thermoleophilaceae bacterium]
MSSPSDGRFAPSPSGRLHLGNLRTALLAWLFARSGGGRFLLRIEDLDRARSRPEHERSQIDDLRAIGLDWDGEPMHQSTRTERYREALEQLRADGRVYPCWCTRAEIRAAAEAPHGALPEGAYPGTCRRLTGAERAERERSGRPAALRLDARAAAVEFEDRLHGHVSGVVDDFVLWRGDDTPAYQLAVVVDDHDQGVNEVVRGDDLLDSTPRQLHLARLLELNEPRYAHVPLVLGEDGARLAKRHGAVTLEGWPPADALSWMAASVGLAEAGERVRPAELIERFDPRALPRTATTLLTSREPAGPSS